MSNFDVAFFKDLLKEERRECLEGPGLDLELHEAFVEACQAFQYAKEAKDIAESEEEGQRTKILMDEAQHSHANPHGNIAALEGNHSKDGIQPT